MLEDLATAVRQEAEKGIQMTEAEVTAPLFAENMILYMSP